MWDALVRKFEGLKKELEEQLNNYELSKEVKKAVLKALKKASEDDPILVILWNQQRLAELEALNPHHTRNALVGTILGCAGVAGVPPASFEVFNIRSPPDYVMMENMLKNAHPWCLGGYGRPPFPEAAGKAILITDTRRSPGVFPSPLFGF